MSREHMRKEKKKESKKETYYKKEKTNRQHATICQSSRNKSATYLNIKQKNKENIRN
jgi:hypothetical protein